MRLLSTAALALFIAAPAMATPVVLDFETAPSFESIGDLYGAISVRFGGDALGLQNDALGPYFSNAPSPVGVMAIVGPDATMNVTGGFADLFSFSYASVGASAGAVNIWSGLDGTGNLLASFDLLGNAQDGCSDTAYCHFDRLSSSFAGLAYSATFSAGEFAFDDIGFNYVPEPASMLLVSMGLAGLVASRRRGRR